MCRARGKPQLNTLDCIALSMVPSLGSSRYVNDDHDVDDVMLTRMAPTARWPQDFLLPW